MPAEPALAGAPSFDAILSGGGETGALMRTIDWSRTPVGPVEGWPQSLRTAVSILLDSRFAMYIAWGPEYTQFYNDGYRPILGSRKHPAAMGLRASETFAESWHIIGPMFDGVMAGTAVGSEDWMLPLDRHGYLEECYFTFSYSPIRAENGVVGGVHVTVSETTARVLHERRLRTLRDLAAVAAEGADERQAWTRAMAALADNPLDVPFAALYDLAPDGVTARRVAVTAAVADARLLPDELRLDAGGPWPLAALAAEPAIAREVGGLEGASRAALSPLDAETSAQRDPEGAQPSGQGYSSSVTWIGEPSGPPFGTVYETIVPCASHTVSLPSVHTDEPAVQVRPSTAASCAPAASSSATSGGGGNLHADAARAMHAVAVMDPLIGRIPRRYHWPDHRASLDVRQIWNCAAGRVR